MNEVSIFYDVKEQERRNFKLPSFFVNIWTFVKIKDEGDFLVLLTENQIFEIFESIRL